MTQNNKFSSTIVIKLNIDDYLKGYTSLGIRAYVPYVNQSQFLFRLLRRLWFIMKLPGACIWFNKKLKNMKADNIIVIDPQITIIFLKWVRKYNISSKIIFLYSNIADTTIVKPNQLTNDICDKVITFDHNDADKYGIQCVEGGYVNTLVDDINVDVSKDIDILFVGRDKGRLNTLVHLQKTFECYHLHTYFHIVGNRNWFTMSRYRYAKFLPHCRYLELLRKSKAILVLLQNGQAGIELRILDALFNEIKIITNYVGIKRYDFYKKENIFILGEDNIDDVCLFLNSPYCRIQENILDKYTIKNYLKEILK